VKERALTAEEIANVRAFRRYLDTLPEPTSCCRALFCCRECGRETKIMLPTSRRHATSKEFLGRPPKGTA
jgi:hypothetical protein